MFVAIQFEIAIIVATFGQIENECDNIEINKPNIVKKARAYNLLRCRFSPL